MRETWNAVLLWLSFSVSAMLAAGLGGAAGCTPDFAPASELPDKNRVVALRAVPPEVQPGERATFEARVHVPAGPAHLAWIACYGDPHGWSENCVAKQLAAGASLAPCGEQGPTDGSTLCVARGSGATISDENGGGGGGDGAVDARGADATALVPVPADYPLVIPDDDGVPTRAVVQVQLVVSSAPDPLAACADALAAVRPDDGCRLAVKRLVVSRRDSLNVNPRVAALRVGGAEADPAAVFPLSEAGVAAGDLAVELELWLDPASIDDAVDEAGRPDETFLEVRWYSDCGSLGDEGGRIRCDPGPTAADPPRCDPEPVQWKPGGAGTCQVHAVVYDGRGGVGWWTQTFTVTDGRGVADRAPGS